MTLLPSKTPLLALCTLILSGFSFSGASAQGVSVVANPVAYDGFQLPTVGGSLQYSLTAGESILFGYNGEPGTGANPITSFSGNLAYLSKSENHPFSAVYSGGYLIGTSNEPSYPFQNLALSQVLRTRSWNFVLADSVSYLPQTPTTGLSGIPGIGDIGVAPIQNTSTAGLGILTDYSTRISNNVSGTASRNLTGSTSLQGTGGYTIQRFLGNSVGLSSDQITGGGGIEHRIDARSSFGVNYNYAASTFTNAQYSFSTQTLLFQYSRQLTRRLSMNVSAGPQRVASGNNTLSGPSNNVAGGAGLSYNGQKTIYSLSYSRGINNGDGVVVGSRSDSLSLGANRQLNRVWNLSAVVGYNHSTSLPSLILPSFSNNGIVFSGQASRALTHTLSVFASYTIQRQSVQGLAAVNNAFNGLSQVLGFGITYAPKPFLGRR